MPKLDREEPWLPLALPNTGGAAVLSAGPDDDEDDDFDPHEDDDDGGGFEIEMGVAMRQPEIDRQAEGGAGAEADQQIHIAAARLDGAPGGPVETRPEPELDRQGECELPGGRQHPVGAEQGGQHRHDQRQDEQAADQHRQAFAPGVISRGIEAVGQRRPVAGGDHGFDQARSRDFAAQMNAGGFAGQIDAGCFDAGYGGQRLFDATGAGSAGHAADGEGDFCRHFKLH